jgi:hypothetical protein
MLMESFSAASAINEYYFGSISTQPTLLPQHGQCRIIALQKAG